MRITVDTLRTLREGQSVRYTKGEGDERVEAIASIETVLPDCLRLRVVELVEQGPANRYTVGQIITAMPGIHEMLELIPYQERGLSESRGGQSWFN